MFTRGIIPQISLAVGRKPNLSEKEIRRRDRAHKTLKGKMVSAGMHERYLKSALQFIRFTVEFRYVVAAWDDLDEVVSEWLEHIFHDGEHKTLASDGLACNTFCLRQSDA